MPPSSYKEAMDWGMMERVKPIVSVRMDGMSASQLAGGPAQQPYFRFDMP